VFLNKLEWVSWQSVARLVRTLVWLFRGAGILPLTIRWGYYNHALRQVANSFNKVIRCAQRHATMFVQVYAIFFSLVNRIWMFRNGRSAEMFISGACEFFLLDLLSICLGFFVTMKSNVNFNETGLTINVNRKPWIKTSIV